MSDSPELQPTLDWTATFSAFLDANGLPDDAERVRAVAALLDRAPSPGVGEWPPIETAPQDGTPVLVFFADRVWTDQAGEAASFGPVRDYVERVEVAFFEGGDWCQAGTGHDYFEGFRYEDELPTHWCALPPPPLARLSADASPATPREDADDERSV